MAIQPYGDRIVVKALEAQKVSKGGILLPETAQEKSQEGKVIAVGEGKTLESGQIKTIKVKVGDRVLFSKQAEYSGAAFTTFDGEELLIIKEEDIIAILK